MIEEPVIGEMVSEKERAAFRCGLELGIGIGQQRERRAAGHVSLLTLAIGVVAGVWLAVVAVALASVIVWPF